MKRNLTFYVKINKFLVNGISREQYQKLIEKEIDKASGKTGFRYEKNSKNMFAILNVYGSQEKAIKNSEKLESLFNDRSYANHNPCTKVHKLIIELIKLIEEYAV